MKTESYTFDTPQEAAAFLQGVQFVNDSALTASVDPEDDCTIITEDQDASYDDNKDPDPRATTTEYTDTCID